VTSNEHHRLANAPQKTLLYIDNLARKTENKPIKMHPRTARGIASISYHPNSPGLAANAASTGTALAYSTPRPDPYPQIHASNYLLLQLRISSGY
jgi:hypothetical protein